MANISKDEVWELYSKVRDASDDIGYINHCKPFLSDGSYISLFEQASGRLAAASIDFADYFCREHQEEFFNLFELGDKPNGS